MIDAATVVLYRPFELKIATLALMTCKKNTLAVASDSPVE